MPTTNLSYTSLQLCRYEEGTISFLPIFPNYPDVGHTQYNVFLLVCKILLFTKKGYVDCHIHLFHYIYFGQQKIISNKNFTTSAKHMYPYINENIVDYTKWKIGDTPMAKSRAI